MATDKKKQKKDKQWWKKSTRIVGMDPVTFKEWWRIKINRVQLISVLVLVFMLSGGVFFIVFSYTPARYLMPNSVTNKDRIKIENTIHQLKEQKKKVNLMGNYISNLQAVILGEVPIDSVYNTTAYDSLSTDEIEMDTSISSVERELDQNIRSTQEQQKDQEQALFEHLYLFDPIEGEISRKFRIPNHPGVDIVATKNAKIKACLNGVVIHSSYNDQDGHTLILSHKNDVISVYKHAKEVFVAVGDNVSTGDAIAIVGNSGKATSGPHLHFELWSNLGPIDPLDYFSFGR